MIGCVHLEKTDDAAYLGMFVNSRPFKAVAVSVSVHASRRSRGTETVGREEDVDVGDQRSLPN